MSTDKGSEHERPDPPPGGVPGGPGTDRSDAPSNGQTGGGALASWFAGRLGGVLVPFAAAVLAFFIGGALVPVPGHTGRPPFDPPRAVLHRNRPHPAS